MSNGNPVGASFVILGLCAALALSVSACSSMPDEGSSVPIREQLYGGDNRDRAPVHQEKKREATSAGSRSAHASRS
jgi:hypothetical protein